MAKGEAKKTNRFVDTERDRLNTEHGRLTDTLYNALPGAQQRSGQVFNRAYQGYDDFLGNIRNVGGGGRNYEDIENRYRDLADTGGVDEEGRYRIRGKGVFDEFARTGGVSEADKTNLRARGTATIPSFFENLKQNLERSRNAQGGYNPGYGDQAAKLSRDAARGAQDAALNAETGIIDRVLEGRKWGSSSLSSAEQGLQELLQSGRLAGLEGMFGTRRAGSQDALQAAGLELGGLEGLRGLRTDVPGEEANLYDMLLRSMGQRGQLVGGNLEGRMAYNPNRSAWDKFKDLAGVAAPVAGAFMGMPGAGAGFARGEPAPGRRYSSSGQPARYNQYYGD